MRPKAIYIEDNPNNRDTDYRVIFDLGGGKQVEHVFTVEEIEDIGPGVTYSHETWAFCRDYLLKMYSDAVHAIHKALRATEDVSKSAESQ